MISAVTDAGFALFDTPIGRCAIAWQDAAVIGLQLPEANDESALARMARRFPGFVPAEPPEFAKTLIGQVAAHLGGARVDYAKAPLALARTGAFEASVYRAALAIPWGETRTYGALAAGLGEPGAAQAVGQALGRNPWPIVVPCHRITAADGRTGGFSAPGGAATKLRLLEIEGALAPETLPLFAPPA